MLVSPAEHNMLRGLGRTSPTPEKYGADFLITSKDLGIVGVQRKEINDLVASVRDGRIQREVAMMKALGLGVFVIEGRIAWTTDGKLLSKSSDWTIQQHYGVLWSLQLEGYWIHSTSDMVGTYQWLTTFAHWLTIPSSKHRSVKTRPGPVAPWGKAANRDWGIHLLQSFDGIGYELAGRIWDRFGGLPLRWEVDAAGLAEVAGIGKVRAEKMIGALVGKAGKAGKAGKTKAGTQAQVRKTIIEPKGKDAQWLT